MNATSRRRTTFVLGAGFSVEQQFPLVRGLKERVVHFLEAERHSRYEAFLVPSAEFPAGQFYAGLRCVGNADALAFEELLIALRKHRAAAGRMCPCSVTDDVLRIGTARLLWCKTSFAKPLEACYREFARWLVRGHGHRNVVTFNWDILVEQALSEVGSSWHYAVSDELFAPMILKPHGSINWSGWATDPTRSSAYVGWKPLGPGSRLMFDSANPLENPDTYDIHSDLRVCIYPGDPDLPGDDPDLSLIWRDIVRVIDAADEVVFIGYALPEYDSFAVTTLQKACTGKQVAVFDPSDTTLERFRATFPGASLHKKEFRQTQYAQRE